MYPNPKDVEAARARLRQSRPENKEKQIKYHSVQDMPNIEIREIKGILKDHSAPLFMVYTNMRDGDPKLWSYRGNRRDLPEALELAQALQNEMAVTHA